MSAAEHPLNTLLAASDQAVLLSVLEHGAQVSPCNPDTLARSLGTDHATAVATLQASQDALEPVLYQSALLSDAAAIQALLPADTHPKLAKLLAKLILDALPGWRKAALTAAPGPAECTDVQWRVVRSETAAAPADGAGQLTAQFTVRTQDGKSTELSLTRSQLALALARAERMEKALQGLAGSA